MTPRSTITHALPAGAEHPTEGRAIALCSLSVRADQVVGSLNATCKRCQRAISRAFDPDHQAPPQSVDEAWAAIQAQ